MRETSGHDLAAVHDGLVALSELVLAAIREATDAFNTADAALADKALATSRRIESLAAELDDLAMGVPTRQTLTPRDVQALLCHERTSARLARMGDFTRHIAQIARRYSPEAVVPEGRQAGFVQMSAQVVDAAELVTRLLRSQDLEVVEELVEDDDWTDVLQRAAFAAVGSPDWDGGAERAVHLILAARYLERFGDHAVLIATKIAALRAAAGAAAR